ncbi:MAG TPA: hypothetical protein VF201_00440 [Nitrolancea sp.]
MRSPFEEIFHTSNPARDKYLSRLFGLFSEEVVRQWCKCPEAPFEDIGRPTLRLAGERRGQTLDFTLRDRTTSHLFVAELKCELEFEGYRFLRLRSPDQIKHHYIPPSSPVAFKRFVHLASNPKAFSVRVARKSVDVDGAILVWGSIKQDARPAIMAEYGFANILSVESMLADLTLWDSADWMRRVDEIQSWSNTLFSYLRDADNTSTHNHL